MTLRAASATHKTVTDGWGGREYVGPDGQTTMPPRILWHFFVSAWAARPSLTRQFVRRRRQHDPRSNYGCAEAVSRSASGKARVSAIVAQLVPAADIH